MTTIIAHRGYSSKFPENTMLAFKEAGRHAIYGIELDIHLSKDEEIVICHDETIDRTSNGSGWIKDLTLDQLKSYSFHNQMTDFENLDDTKIPTLREFFDWFQDFDFIVNIEFKTNIFRYPGMAQKVVDLVAEYDLNDRILISSFNHPSITEVQALNPTIQLGFLTLAGLLEPGSYCAKYEVGNYHPAYTSLDPANFKNCQDNGVAINAFTVDDPNHMKPLIEAGVDNLITNDVELAIKVLQET